MNKTAIRNFAIWARNKLIADGSCYSCEEKRSSTRAFLYEFKKVKTR